MVLDEDRDSDLGAVSIIAGFDRGEGLDAEIKLAPTEKDETDTLGDHPRI